MARGARKSLQEKIAQKEELIEALTTRLKKEKEELNELVQQQKMEELDELRAAVEKSGMEIAISFPLASANTSSIISTDSLLNTSKCTLSFVFGAAIKNISVTGCPSNASNSTPSFTTIAARPGFVTASHFP